MFTTPYVVGAELVARTAGLDVVDVRDTPLTAVSQHDVADAIAEVVEPVD
jgi:hypothetical protein